MLVYRPFEKTLVQRLEVMNETFTLLLMYNAMTLDLNWVNSDIPRTTVGTVIIGLISLSIIINFVFLFRTLFREFENKLFRQKGKANKCCLRLFQRCSPKLRQAAAYRK